MEGEAEILSRDKPIFSSTEDFDNFFIDLKNKTDPEVADALKKCFRFISFEDHYNCASQLLDYHLKHHPNSPIVFVRMKLHSYTSLNDSRIRTSGDFMERLVIAVA